MKMGTMRTSAGTSSWARRHLMSCLVWESSSSQDELQKRLTTTIRPISTTAI